MIRSAYHCVHDTSCLCTLSASAFIEPSLHQLDFFRNLLWGLQLHTIKWEYLSITITIIIFLQKSLLYYYYTVSCNLHYITVTPSPLLVYTKGKNNRWVATSKSCTHPAYYGSVYMTLFHQICSKSTYRRSNLALPYYECPHEAISNAEIGV